MISRRTLLHAAAASPGALAAATYSIDQSYAADLADFAEFGFIGPEDDPAFGPVIRGEKMTPSGVGTEPSRHGEVARAFALLFNVDRNNGSLGAAQYFLNLKEKNEEGAPYNWEWEKRANPLIVGFFSMTNTLPSEGDQTAWCAAFVNFCLYAAKKKSMFSAASGKFKAYGHQTEDPEPGDIAVFEAATTEAANRGEGHVAFFLSRTSDTVTVIGGNQRPQPDGTTKKLKSNGAITISKFKREGKDLRLWGYQKVVPAEE
jgi:uncharacterized protein (TIGR02594 family)